MTNTTTKPRRWLFLVALVAVIGGGAFLYLTGRLPLGPAEKVEPVAQVEVAPRTVTALGEVLPVSNMITVAGPTGQDAGRIAEIRVEEGETVTRGQVLAILDTEPQLNAELSQAMANEAVRRAALSVKTADLEAAEGELTAQVGQLKAALDKAQNELDQMARLSETGVWEETALIEKRLDVQSATYNLRNVEIQLERNRLTTEDGIRIDTASAKAELEAATAARVRAEAEYAKSSVVAPADGRILALYGRVGEQIDSSTGFATMGDTRNMKIRSEVYETDVPLVSEGQAVTATSRAIEGELKGTVSRIGVRISDQSILSTDPAAIVDARVVEVWIMLDEDSSKRAANLSGLQVLVAFSPEGDGGV
jgi:HlyD family secretion protein